jgi:hypothetical protein
MSPVNVDEDPLQSKIRLLVDPVSEMFNSLHVLADASHHQSTSVILTYHITSIFVEEEYTLEKG